jgi:hypothetical protein
MEIFGHHSKVLISSFKHLKSNLLRITMKIQPMLRGKRCEEWVASKTFRGIIYTKIVGDFSREAPEEKGGRRGGAKYRPARDFKNPSLSQNPPPPPHGKVL